MTPESAPRPAPPEELLTAVLQHDHAIWGPTPSAGVIGRRNRAAHAAMDAGWTADEIAHHVRVMPADVRRWVSMAARHH